MCSPAGSASPAVTGKHKLPKIETSLTTTLRQGLCQEPEDLHSVPGSAAGWLENIESLTASVCLSFFSLFASVSPAVTEALLSNTPSVLIS